MKRGLFVAAVVAFAVVLVVMSPFSARGQVAIWPGSVVAPFVHVQWNDRQVHVCAPFVNLVVDLPWCCCQPAACSRTCESTADDGRFMGGMYGHATRQQLATAARELYQSLGQLETAESWRSYLDVAPGETLSADRLDAPADTSVDRESLTVVLRHFDSANRDDRYSVINRLPEFQRMHTVLANYMAQQRMPVNSGTTPASLMMASSTLANRGQVAGAIDTARIPGRVISASAAENAKNATGGPRPTVMVGHAEELPVPAEHSGI
jgi:hypothetical protein